jgi:hypothetical protein
MGTEQVDKPDSNDFPDHLPAADETVSCCDSILSMGSASFAGPGTFSSSSCKRGNPANLLPLPGSIFQISVLQFRYLDIIIP